MTPRRSGPTIAATHAAACATLVVSRGRWTGGGVRIGVISDVHGNSWALKAVLGDLAGRSLDWLVDLGDSVYGPLDPEGTASILLARGIPSVRGNEDRIVVAPPADDDSPTLQFTRSCLSRPQLQWLASLPASLAPFPGLYCCHGSPERDDEYLLEHVSPSGVLLKSPSAVAAQLAAVRRAVVLCGHSHLPRAVELPDGRLVANPGSVGLPSFSDATPIPHAMETGSPHARYAVVSKTPAGWRVEHVAVPYDWEAACDAASRHDREDWARWLRTGRAGPPQ